MVIMGLHRPGIEVVQQYQKVSSTKYQLILENSLSNQLSTGVEKLKVVFQVFSISHEMKS